MVSYRALLPCLFFLGINPALSATQGQVDQAGNKSLAWLYQNQNGDGSWSGAAHDAKMQTTSAALDAFRVAGIQSGYTYSSAISWVTNAYPPSVDSTARQVIALAKAGMNIQHQVNRLLGMRNERTLGWGAYPGFQASFPDTALALDAILESNTSYSDTGVSLGFVVSNQNIDGGWSYSAAGTDISQSRLIPTAYVVYTLARHRSMGWGVDSWINTGVTWLVDRLLSDGGFAEDDNATTGEMNETALVVRALQAAQDAGNAVALDAQGTLDAGLDFLIENQNPDGNWSGDALRTSVVLTSLPVSLFPDSDNDGIPDGVEPLIGTNPNTPDGRELAKGNGDAEIGITAPLFIANAMIGEAFQSTLSSVGGTPPYSWSLLGGVLPNGLDLNASTGEITGTPTVAGSFNFTYEVLDSGGLTATTTGQIQVTEAQPSSVQVPALPIWGLAAMLLGLLGIRFSAGVRRS